MDIATSPAPHPSLPAWSAQEFEAQLRDKGAAYHIHHPFNVRMNAGGCTADELRCWVANRFYYQICIPRKDAAILANMPDRAHRRLWVERILDHDGQGDHQGGNAGGQKLHGLFHQSFLCTEFGYHSRLAGLQASFYWHSLPPAPRRSARIDIAPYKFNRNTLK